MLDTLTKTVLNDLIAYMKFIWPIFLVQRLIAKSRKSKDLPPED